MGCFFFPPPVRPPPTRAPLSLVFSLCVGGKAGRPAGETATKKDVITGLNLLGRTLVRFESPNVVPQSVVIVFKASLADINDDNFHDGFLSLVTPTSVCHTGSTPPEMDLSNPSQHRVPARRV